MRPLLRPRIGRRPSALSLFVASWIAVFLVCAGWSSASPIASGPDENSHAVKAVATVRGMLTGAPTQYPGNTSFRLPADVATLGPATTCFVGKTDRTAACAPSQDGLGHGLVTALTGVGSYYPLYYAVVGWPSLVLDGSASFHAMRLVSALVNSFFIAILFLVAAWMPRARAMSGFVLVTLTPMVLYLGGVLNPSGVETTACAAVAALALLLLHDRSGHRLVTRSVLLAIAVVAAGSGRATSQIDVAVILVAVALTVPVRRLADVARRRPVWVSAAAAGTALVPALIWTVLVAAPAGYIPSSDPARPGVVAAAVHTIESTGDYGRVIIGVFGWLDAPPSDAVTVGWTAGIGVVVLAALTAGPWRLRLGAVVLMAALLLVPVALQAPTAHEFGYIWEGRYSLPLFVAMMVVGGYVAARYAYRDAAARRIVPVLAGLAVIAQVQGFLAAYRRFSIGTSSPWRSLLDGTGWQAPGGIWPSTTLFVVGVVGIAVIAVVLSRSRPTGDSPADDGRLERTGAGRAAR
ncbi:DUF2142 domain-containing protein [Curtobacterium sp. RRHDQ10]|uniref:DUF2142 domain-containing protein n=1 Tax=Curtobacterium phyllosphaerae TaxID=3413379 RepID=UPI003BEF930E